MRRLILGFVVAIVAICGSAFKSAPKKSNLANAYYVLLSPNLYQYYGPSIPSSDGCLDEQPRSCFIGYDVKPAGDSYPADALPATPDFESENNGIWREP